MKYLKIYEEFTDHISVKDLEVKDSTIPNSGKGLFTLVDIPKDTPIVEFTGKKISQKRADRLTGSKSEYLIELSDGSLLDVYESKSVAKYANDAAFSGGKNNSEIQEFEGNKIWLVSTKKIKAGQEVFCSYGKEYWESWKKQNSKS